VIDRLCDASSENCRSGTPEKPGLIDLINAESKGIDVGVWFWKDDRIVTALVKAKTRGVPIRIIMDPRASDAYPTNAGALTKLAAAGIQMRKRIGSDICHWKLMIFAGQGVVEWSGANYSPTAFVPQVPYKDYEDEVIFFSTRLFPSFTTMFDNIWTNTKEYASYANITGPLTRVYPTFPIDPRLNFPPKDSYQDRLVPLIDSEPPAGLIDVDIYRVTMARPVDALIRAAARGVRIRIYLEPNEYANTARPDNKVQMDRLVAAAHQYPGTIEIRMRKHLGLNHQKTVWLHAQHVVVFGTSNWSDASDDNQLEANIFTDKMPGDPLNDLLFTDLHRVFERKWYNQAPDGSIETEAWKTPTLPPPAPATTCLDPKASNYGGPLPCVYPPPPAPLPPPPAGATTVVLYASKGTPVGDWQVLSDATAAGGKAMWNPNRPAAKIAPALASPASYFELTFPAMGGVAYHVWIRMRAQDNSTSNDSVHVQFSDAVAGAGSTTRTMAIGSTSSGEFVLQDGPSGGSNSNWGWTDSGWGVPGAPIYFETTGTHTLRVQQREDGAIIDQIVLSPDTYRTAAPGPHANDAMLLPEASGGANPST
jgi:PLD-like domain